MVASLSIEVYKRKQNALKVKAHKRCARMSSSRSTSNSNATYTIDQQRYLDACVKNHMDADARLLRALREKCFVLKLDRFGEEELAFNMGYLQKTRTCKQIRLSLGSVAVKRDLRTKFDRLGLEKTYAYENKGASIVVRSACVSVYRTPDLMRFYLIGVTILPDVIPLLSKALCHCLQLEDVSLNGTNLGDKGLEAIATLLGKCPKLRSVSLARCSLTDEAKDHIAKIISLHGVLEDEAIWSSSLREEVVPAPSMPQLMMNLSHNDLGDETAESICDALYNDKWLLGLNLGSNNLSQQGTRRFAETLMKNNQTLAVLSLANMKNPVETSTLNTFNSLLHDRDRFLQQVATESREKRMALGSLLLEWGVEKNKVVEICYVESPGRAASTKSISTTSGKIVSEPSNARNGCVYHSRTTVSSDADRVSQHPNSNDISNNDNTEDDEDRKYDTIGDSSANNHVKTIEYLIERLSAMEVEKRKTQEYVNKVETENRQLRAELEALSKSAPAPSLSLVEAQIIAQLESSITSLVEQVEVMEHEKQQKM